MYVLNIQDGHGDFRSIQNIGTTIVPRPGTHPRAGHASVSSGARRAQAPRYRWIGMSARNSASFTLPAAQQAPLCVDPRGTLLPL